MPQPWAERRAKVRKFVDRDDQWPAAQAYAAEHGLAGGASEVIRLALAAFLSGVADHTYREHLKAAGWASPEVVRALVEAAGGRIDLTWDVLVDPPAELVTWDDPVTRARVLQTRPSPNG